MKTIHGQKKTSLFFVPTIIVGCRRGGTTYLDSVLGAHPGVFILRGTRCPANRRMNGHRLPERLRFWLFFQKPRIRKWYHSKPFRVVNVATVIQRIHERKARTKGTHMWGQKTLRLIEPVFTFLGLPPIGYTELDKSNREPRFHGAGFKHRALPDGLLPETKGAAAWRQHLSPSQIEHAGCICMPHLPTLGFERIAASTRKCCPLRNHHLRITIWDTTIMSLYLFLWPICLFCKCLRQTVFRAFAILLAGAEEYQACVEVNSA